jgi:hypothetical protein
MGAHGADATASDDNDFTHNYLSQILICGQSYCFFLTIANYGAENASAKQTYWIWSIKTVELSNFFCRISHLQVILRLQ